jgi:hypothetical protein
METMVIQWRKINEITGHGTVDGRYIDRKQVEKII